MTRLPALIVVALGCSVLAVIATASLAGAQAQPLTLTLTSQNNSGVTGTATLTDLGGGKTRVAIQASGAGPGPEPAHIHPGTCSQLDATPAFTLTSVTNGSSTTEIDTSLQQLTSTPFAVHMHKSQDELTVYVACANITSSGAPGTLPKSGDLGGAWPAQVAGLAGLSFVLAGLAVRRLARRGAA